MIHQYTRRNHDGNAVETLSLVRRDRDGELVVQIESGTPADRERDFVGLYSVDGDQLQLGNETWELAEDVPDAAADEIFADWESGSYLVERWVAKT